MTNKFYHKHLKLSIGYTITMNSFIFVRHGRSQANQDGQIATNDSPLTKEGEAQSRKVGRTLKKFDIKVIVTSPYPRARQTAEIIAKQLKLDGVEVIDDLRERGFGELEGGPKDHPSQWYYTIDGELDVEPRGVLIARCEAALAKIKKLSEQGKVLVVGHAVSGYYLRQVAGGTRFFDDFDTQKELPNVGYAEVAIAERIPMKPASRQAVIAILAVVVGATCLVTGMWLMLQRPGAAPERQVKQQSIPLAPEDYQGNPRLQGAIEQQLQQQQGSGQSGTDASGTLQPVTQGIPQDWQ